MSAMTFEVRVTEAFEADLLDALSYLSGSLHAPDAAARLMRAVDVVKDLLAENPFLDAVSERLGRKGHAYREHFVLNYVIVYKVEVETVWFLRLFHQRQSYGRFVLEWR